jgi:DtxR family Mn-dependent transcriptional regulator
MAEPLTALIWGIVFVILACVGFWPGRGLVWRWKRSGRLTERVLLEDALKHIYNGEYKKQTATLISLCGALQLPGGAVSDLVARAEAMRLLESKEGELHLTREGRDYALRILRVHRLWEQYLAEKTGVSESEWHSEAELHEHDLSSDEVDDLAQKMGYPVYDPHGDPIPTPSGELPPRRGQALSILPAGDRAVIVHLEDEPKEVYAQLLAEGLHLGMKVEVTEVNPERIHFWADGDEHILAPILATNISVAPFQDDQEEEEENHDPLSSLQLGESGRVIRLSRGCRGLERRRLMDLGVLPGTIIEAEMRSPGGDPTAYRIRGGTIALRKDQAGHIRIVRNWEAE